MKKLNDFYESPWKLGKSIIFRYLNSADKYYSLCFVVGGAIKRYEE